MAQFSDTTSKTGLIQACERYTNLGYGGISDSTNKLLDFTNWINEGGREVWKVIFRTHSGWIYDDANQTDLPQATTDLVNGTGKYVIPASALTIDRVEVQDEAGNKRLIQPYVLENLGIANDEFQDSNGIPNTYRLVGNTIELKPAPNYDKTSGLKVYFKREGVSFITTDTTDTPGFASVFHDLLAIYASIQWYKIKDATSATYRELKEDWKIGTAQLADFYANNLPANKKGLKRKKQSFK